MAGYAGARTKLVSQWGEPQVKAAEAQSAAERRENGYGRSVRDVLEGRPQRGSRGPQEGLTVQRGRGAQPASLLDAMMAKTQGGAVKVAAAILRSEAAKLDPVMRATLRRVAEQAEGVTSGRARLQFDLFASGGNVSVGRQYWAWVRTQLRDRAITTHQRTLALAVLAELMQHLRFAAEDVDVTAEDLVQLMGVDKVSISKTLTLLEEIGAIARERHGRTKRILITPEGAFRGGLADHQTAVLSFAKRTGKTVEYVGSEDAPGPSV